jgi:hypothetical protein
MTPPSAQNPEIQPCSREEMISTMREDGSISEQDIAKYEHAPMDSSNPWYLIRARCETRKEAARNGPTIHGAILPPYWTLFIPPIQKDEQGQKVVMASTPQSEWKLIPRPGSHDGYSSRSECVVAKLQMAQSFLIGVGGGRDAHLMAKQYEHGECLQSDGTSRFNWTLDNPDFGLVK